MSELMCHRGQQYGAEGNAQPPQEGVAVARCGCYSSTYPRQRSPQLASWPKHLVLVGSSPDGTKSARRKGWWSVPAVRAPSRATARHPRHSAWRGGEVRPPPDTKPPPLCYGSCASAGSSFLI